MKPSRTYTLALVGVGANLLLAVVLVVMAWLVPDQVAEISGTIGTMALGIAGVCGAGAGAMGFRDGMSRGLTSSQAGDARHKFFPGLDIEPMAPMAIRDGEPLIRKGQIQDLELGEEIDASYEMD